MDKKMIIKKMWAVALTLFITALGTESSLAGEESTASKNVFIVPDQEMPTLKRKRTIRLYLPPSYEHSEKRYPVIYMHDGQNLFDEATAYSQEWRIDEQLNKIALDMGIEVIVVGIDNGPRDDEYSPWKRMLSGGGEGDAYVRYIVDTLKPEIDKTLRTLPERENTAIAGSSMGGLITHYAIFKYPEIFSKAVILSPSYWFSDKIVPFTEQALDNLDKPIQLCMKVGDAEPPRMESGMLNMVDLIKSKHISDEHVLTSVAKGGRHSEEYWSQYFGKCILWMFKN